MKQPLLAITLFAVALVSTGADDAKADDIWKGGSIYSQFGLGMPHDVRSSYADGMGVYGTALYDNRQPGSANPATWARAVMTNIAGSFEISSYEAEFDDYRANTTGFRTGPLQLVMPVKRNRVGVSFSITPLTSARYATEVTDRMGAAQNITGENLHYSVRSTGSGGINRIEAGVGVRLTDNISVGYAPSLMLGVIHRNQRVTIDDPDHRAIVLKERTSHYGFGHRFGVFLEYRDAFRENDRMAFGATVSLPVDLNSERRLESRIGSSDITIHPESFYGDGQVTYPLEASAGFTYNINPYWMISADVLYQNWDEYTNFQGNREPFFNDRMKMGMGTQYIASRRDVDTFLSRFIYRMGVSYDTGSLSLNDGQDIETLTLHAGLGLPSFRTSSSININAEYGFRGSDGSGLLSERVFAVRVSFNLSELMFIQRRLQ
ncbi:hypothetical protein QA596_05665 [Balneolales bacterium ANBcel1]|nr:hypothetical protein [Balneolales bacterium ANBcel1]